MTFEDAMAIAAKICSTLSEQDRRSIEALGFDHLLPTVADAAKRMDLWLQGSLANVTVHDVSWAVEELILTTDRKCFSPVVIGTLMLTQISMLTARPEITLHPSIDQAMVDIATAIPHWRSEALKDVTKIVQWVRDCMKDLEARDLQVIQIVLDALESAGRLHEDVRLSQTFLNKQLGAIAATATKTIRRLPWET